MAFTPEPDVVISDEDLVARVRAGDRDAYGVLWQRHSGAALSVARQYQGVADPEDILQEAAKTVFSSILRGGGPFGAFRPYLKQSVRNTAVSISRRRREAPIGGLDEIAEQSAHMTYDDNDNALERMITVRAFKALPARWQEVLWYTCVEGMPAREAATRLGLSANATAALAKRAREGLRRSWLEAHLNDDRLSPDCRAVVHQLPAYERGALNEAAVAEVEGHLAECLRCSIVAGELDRIADRLPVLLLPLALAGIDVFGRGVELAQAFLAAHVVQPGGQAAAAQGGLASGGAAGSGTAVPLVGDPATQAAASAPTAGGGVAGGSGGGAGGTGGGVGGAGASGGASSSVGSIAGVAGNAALVGTKAIWIGALVVGGLATATVAGVNALNSSSSPPPSADSGIHADSRDPLGPGGTDGSSPDDSKTDDDPTDTATTEDTPSADPAGPTAEPRSGNGVPARPMGADQDAPPVGPTPGGSTEPTSPPTGEPTSPPTGEPTSPPTEEPSDPPTGEPTSPPTEEPSDPPTCEPTDPPTDEPSDPVEAVVVAAPRSGVLYTSQFVEGRGEPGAAIDLLGGDVVYASTTVDAEGTWTLKLPVDFSGSVGFGVRQTTRDVAGPVVPVGTYSMASAPSILVWGERGQVSAIVWGRAHAEVQITNAVGKVYVVSLNLTGWALVDLPREFNGSSWITVAYHDPATGLTGRTDTVPVIGGVAPLH